ncbi:3810_t:CDS:2 [Entrophospora sp. SA101]|nr:12066_t:CDS:2 [Entrophospora sp. SA101]CAJ0753891.1 3810_t:CDS:2 [Entrophospora sp. SA101]
MQQPTPVTSTLISSSSSSSFTSSLPQIPQFIVIHDKSQQNWKHPIVHYIFEDEIIPINITQEHCILVGLSEDGEKVENMYSLSHNFQITGYKISSTPQMNSNNNNSISLMLTIEGMSKT